MAGEASGVWRAEEGQHGKYPSVRGGVRLEAQLSKICLVWASTVRSVTNRVDHALALGDPAKRVHQDGGVEHPLLQEIPDSFG
jgi:hypothetical protein